MRVQCTAIQQMAARGIPMVDVYAPIPGKLPFEMMSAGRVELKQKQMRIPTHASRDLGGNPARSRSGSRTNELTLRRSRLLTVQ